MPLSNLTPLSVVKYEKDFIINFVRHKTGWSERNEVARKTQLIYLTRYLENPAINCQTIVAEDEYIDRHFLEDYAEYYARCFPYHQRKCSRLHFFNEKFDEHEFKEALESSDKSLGGRLQNSYIGFAVIRPVPHTCFAKLCLRPFGVHTSKVGRMVLRTRVQVSLFGVGLTVDTIPFIEQDKVVSACATSSLWTALSATKETPLASLPSPSAITKSATHLINDGLRVFPNNGLTAPQVAQSLAHYGLAPTVVHLSDEHYIDDLKERIYAYINNDTPLILGGDVYEKNKDDLRYLGKHLVCVVGYNSIENTSNGDRKLASDAIDKIYIHDDRIGPFIKVKAKPIGFSYEGQKRYALELQVDDVHNNYFVPDVLILGLSHKIRIPYDHISAVCAALQGYLQWTTEDLFAKLDADEGDVKQAHEAFRSIVDGVWDVALVSSIKVKEQLRGEPNFWSYNGLFKKTSLLFQNLPKHIWRCRIYKKNDSGEELLTDILFDATEIPQGRLMVGYVSYSLDADRVWNHVKNQIEYRKWQAYEAENSEGKYYVGSVVRFFSELGDNAKLNTLYGPLGLPRRELKPGETDKSQNIKKRSDLIVLRSGSDKSDFKPLNEAKKYIWVINEVGDIVIGEDIETDEGYEGHPTLIDGKPGRVAGELEYHSGKSVWAVKIKSRAYSGHIKEGSVEADIYLSNVIQQNLIALKCKKASELE